MIALFLFDILRFRRLSDRRREWLNLSELLGDRCCLSCGQIRLLFEHVALPRSGAGPVPPPHARVCSGHACVCSGMRYTIQRAGWPNPEGSGRRWPLGSGV